MDTGNSSTVYFVNGATAVAAPGPQTIPVIQFYFASADYSVGSLTQKFRLRAQVNTGATNPAITYTFGLYRITGISAGAYTFGTVVTGSTVAITPGAANTQAQANSGDFAYNATNLTDPGYYCVGVTKSGTPSGSVAQGLSFLLQTRNA